MIIKVKSGIVFAHKHVTNDPERPGWWRKIKRHEAGYASCLSFNRHLKKFMIFISDYSSSVQIKIKSSLNSLSTLSGVTSERYPTPRLCAKAHTSRMQRWQVVGNVWEI